MMVGSAASMPMNHCVGCNSFLSALEEGQSLSKYNVHCTLARNEGWNVCRIKRFQFDMWLSAWRKMMSCDDIPSLHERLSARAKALVVIATTGAQYYYELIICINIESADRSARRPWADKGKKRIWFSIFDHVTTEPFHAYSLRYPKLKGNNL